MPTTCPVPSKVPAASHHGPGRRRVVTWALPAGTATLVGLPGRFGLTWLFGLDRPGDALALVLRRALAIDAEPVEDDL